MSDNILTAGDLCYKYPDGTCALNKVNLQLARSTRTAILGSNGAGKSTLFLHFNGIYKPASGKMQYQGRDFEYNSRYLQKLKQKVGLVFQNPEYQLFSASVRQDISFGLLNMGMTSAEASERVMEIGEELGICDLFNKATHFLSVGQKKMVSLAGILVMEPEVLVCDEPTAGLDPENAAKLLNILSHRHDQGTTVVLSTHDIDLAYSWADHIFIMDEGRVIAQGNPKQVLADEACLTAIGMHKPWILETWEQLQKNELVSGEVSAPRSQQQLYEALGAIVKQPYQTARN